MENIQDQIGYFLFSLDTELAWGYFDSDPARSRLFSPNGARERRSIERMLEILDQFGIVATWAIIGHLLYERCEECDICPVLAWQGKYHSFEEIYKTDNPLWYGEDVIELLLTKGRRHEIAFHSYTHRIFSEISEEDARIEVQEWLRVAGRKAITPQTVIFPRNEIGHMNVFEEAGFICYRGEEEVPGLHQVKYLGKLLKHIDHTLSLFPSPVYQINPVGPIGLLNFPASDYFFTYHRGIEKVLDALNLHKLRIKRMVKGVRSAAEQRKILHIWAHPWEFQTEKDFEKLRYLFEHVAEEISAGRMRSISMADLTREVVGQRKIDPAPRE